MTIDPDKDDTDATIAMTVSQPVLAPTLLEPQAEPEPPIQRVDFPPVEDAEDGEDTEEQRGPATAWLKDNQLMLTYFLAGESPALE